MKIAIPTRENVVDDHFGHCEAYTVYTVSDNAIVESEQLASPEGCGCKSNIASVLQEKGVKVMLAGNMGNGALNKLNAHGIDVIRGCSGNVKELAEAYLEKKLSDSGEGCQQHNQHAAGHQCQH